jgi:hypothetical protein
MTNKAAFREIVERGPPPGLLAFDGDLAVGLCQLTPRDQVPALAAYPLDRNPHPECDVHRDRIDI